MEIPKSKWEQKTTIKGYLNKLMVDFESEDEKKELGSFQTGWLGRKSCNDPVGENSSHLEQK